MHGNGRWILVASIALGVTLSGCRNAETAHHREQPAQVEHIDGSDIARVTFTEQAMQRVDVQTASIREEQVKGIDFKVVPYSSLIYDPHGHTWVYTSPQPRVFLRRQVSVDRIEGDWVYLGDGPPVGTEVASVGVAEIYGTEFEIGH